jgi:two-component SAPR family response regulator
MSETQQALRILVVEDEYLLAMDLQEQLNDEGLDVVGPVGSVKGALDLLDTEAVDAAVLDISLNGENIIPVVEVLSKKGIPFVFATGYDAFDLPNAWQNIPRFEKPVDVSSLVIVLRDKARPQ